MLARIGERCVEHPHRPPAGRCHRCGRPFCVECLVPGERRADGTRGWFCAACRAADAAERAAAAAARTWRARAARGLARGRRLLLGLAAAGTVAALVAAAVRAGSGEGGGGVSGLAQAVRCGELSRMRSVGAVGLPGPAETVNLLALPHRATVQLAAPGGEAAGGADADALEGVVDECDSGWRGDAGAGAPLSLLVTPARTNAWLQRVVLWQDPAAAESSWIKDFELLASPSPAGDDFRPVTLDRPARLQATREQQWFQAVQPAPTGTTPADRLDPIQRARYGQPFPAAVPVRRLLVRVLSTYGEGAGVSLGELAAFGPDVEVAIDDALCPDPGGRPPVGCYAFQPAAVRALAGRPTPVLFLNRSTTAHVLVSAGQERNLDVRLEPGQVASGVFVAAGRPGSYELFCRVPGHDREGLLGAVVVR